MTKEEFKHIRLKHKLTQKALAEIIELKPNTISCIERGNRDVSRVIAKVMRNLSCFIKVKE